MKIVHYSYDSIKNPYCGGGGAYREFMIHSALAQKHEIYFYIGNYKNAFPYRDHGIRYIPIGIKTSYILSRISFALCATIHSLFVKTDILVITYSVYAPVVTFIFKRKKTILEFYHLVHMEAVRKYKFFGLFPLIAEFIAIQYGTNFITLTDSMANYLLSKSPRCKVAPTYTGYDTTFLSTTSSEKQYILYFGRIDVHMKGIDVLIDAFEQIAHIFQHYSLVLAGRASEHDRQWLVRRIKNSPFSEKIFYKHNVSTDIKRELFFNAAFVCMPSRFEGWCISAIEAAACSKATIGTEIMGLKDSIRNGETGILVKPGDTASLAQAMTTLLTDKNVRTRLGMNGHIWAQNFTWERISRLQENFYRDIYTSLK